MAIFITGTDTNVGKTLIATWLCLHTGAKYWKPIQSGSEEGTDTDFIKSSGMETYPESYLLQNPLSPHTAAAMENITIDPEHIHLPADKRLIVEGAGGVLVPIKTNYLMTNLMVDLGLPVLVVARSTLGTINHTCLTLEALRSRNIAVLGIIMNGPYNPQNNQSVEEFGNTKVLASFPLLETFNSNALTEITLPATLKEVLEKNL